ncbi:MAG: DNA-binding Lrp family transcriptional regulator [Natronomonas sp.]|jgi:DNA-binding Lrp family transcriptional regulator|uniref:siroheme decarboxylase subunit beta n=1 Tax=Natronomonas sp. TaxID=2184060 RepID=UPI003989BCCB
MSTPAAGDEDWRADIDDIDAALIDGYQSGFPIAERPFARVADALGITEDAALDRVQRLHDRGIFRRFGPVLNPPVIGASTLAAVQAPDDRFEEVAEIINSYEQVNHNYRRDHEWNMWFVVTAGSLETRDDILAEIEKRTGCTVLNLPMMTDFYIDLEFPVVNSDSFARETHSVSESGEEPDDTRDAGVGATRIAETAAANLSALDRALLLEIQEGFPLSKTPYQDVAEAVDAPVDEVLDAIARLQDEGCIKRIGCVVNHVITGFDANCMVVWDVPDEELDERGIDVGGLPYVTLCYHRPRRPEQGWPYNLFTMIHGRDPAAVDEKIDELAAEHLPFEHERLYSTETLKQTGARYEEIVGE